MRVGDGRVMFIKGKLMPSDTEYEVVRTIVQCKDCKYWAENKTTKGSYRNCIFSKTMMHADDFCSRAEIGNKTT